MFSIEYLRQFRLGGYAIFDFTVSFLGVALLAPLLSKLFRKIRVDVPVVNWLFFTLPVAIVTHIVIGNITPMTKYFLDTEDHYVLKLVIVGSFLLGLRNIRILKKSKPSKKKAKFSTLVKLI